MNYPEVNHINFGKRFEQPRYGCVRVGKRLFSEFKLMLRGITLAIPRMNLSGAPFDLQTVSSPDQSQPIGPHLTPVLK